MKVRTAILIPALGLMMSACTTSSRQQTDSVVEPANNSAPIVSNVAEKSENEVELEKVLNSKNTLIDSLQKQLLDNQRQLASLNKSLNEKDTLIASLQNATISPKKLAELEKQKQLREALEFRYAALKLDNDLLKRRINQLENENVSLQKQVSSLENMPTSQNGFKQSYFDLLDENTKLQEMYANLEADNLANQKRLTALKSENLALGGALSEARAHHQVLWDKIHQLGGDDIPAEEMPKTTANNSAADIPNVANDTDNTLLRIELAELQDQLMAQKALVEEYKNDILKLEAVIDEGAGYESRLKDLDNKLAMAQQNNASLTAQLNAVGDELNAVSIRLAATKQALDAKENSDIAVSASIEALLSQMSASLQNVQWQLPSEIALNDNFEILVFANVSSSISGQVYQAELVTDSDIQMISNSVASATVQNGRLQWRWRVSGLNEKPNAELNLIVHQQIAFQGETIQRQIYRGSETLSLVNNNLFEKYGYWGLAILFGLLGGFIVGRLIKPRNQLDINS